MRLRRGARSFAKRQIPKGNDRKKGKSEGKNKGKNKSKDKSKDKSWWRGVRVAHISKTGRFGAANHRRETSILRCSPLACRRAAHPDCGAPWSGSVLGRAPAWSCRPRRPVKVNSKHEAGLGRIRSTAGRGCAGKAGRGSAAARGECHVRRPRRPEPIARTASR